MKNNILALVAVLALAACNNEANTNPTSETNAAAEMAQKAEIETAKIAEPEKLPDLKIMPFGLPMAPDTRIAGSGINQIFIGGLYYEASGILAAKGNPKDVVDFYEKALKDRGFRIFSKRNDPDKPGFAAKHDSRGETFSFSVASRFIEILDQEKGETSFWVVFKIPSLDRKKQ